MLIPTTALLASVVVAISGMVILWANPFRSVNRAVCGCSLNIATWLACWHAAITSKVNGLFWVKCTCATGALVALSFWLVKEILLARPDIFSRAWLRRSWGWFVIPGLIAIVPFTESFIPSHSTGAMRVYGWGYHSYMAVNLSLYLLLIWEASRIKTLASDRQMEMQVWLGGGSAMFVTVFILMALSTLTKDPIYRRMEPLVVLVFFAGIAYTITTHRIFDARQILLVGTEKMLLVAIVATVAGALNFVFNLMLSETLSLVATTVGALGCASLFNGWLDRVFRFYPQAMSARQAAFAVAGRETRMENLEPAFLSVLKGWGQSDHALLMHGTKDTLRGGGIEMPGGGTVAGAMRQLRWATPERLVRERPTPERREVAKFLKDHSLGVLVIGEGPTLSALVGVGLAASRQPFTYPQVMQLMELASIMESALERAHLSMKVQHTEQLATVGLLGASLAHEIRNPLVTIKTFVQLLPQHHQDPAFREKFFRLIGSEVNRIDRLTEQLLDLASPRTYLAEVLELHPVLRTSLDLVAAKATDKNIQFLTEFKAAPDQAYTDASAAKQVMLNLCFNAIQAVESRAEARWVKVSTRNVPNGIEMAVADSGPGIAAEIRPRLFQPFQTTKSSGFGLGLAICSDILANLDATISVDPPAPGRGATFRVIFPCQP